jgi:hypothetical protein
MGSPGFHWPSGDAGARDEAAAAGGGGAGGGSGPLPTGDVAATASSGVGATQQRPGALQPPPMSCAGARRAKEHTQRRRGRTRGETQRQQRGAI